MDNKNLSQKILRFRKSERIMHWAVAVPFMVCYTTALVLIIFYNSQPDRPFRSVFSLSHQISGIVLLITPLIVLLIYRHDIGVYLDNLRQVLAWDKDDFRWVYLRGISVINKKISLPEQGKFNALEKLNFIILLLIYPSYIFTGILTWITGNTLLPWITHFSIAIIGTPIFLGHIFMAMFNPNTRTALSGMISGLVDRQYVQHHHARWYKENFNSVKHAAGGKDRDYRPE